MTVGVSAAARIPVLLMGEPATSIPCLQTEGLVSHCDVLTCLEAFGLPVDVCTSSLATQDLLTGVKLRNCECLFLSPLLAHS